ncbi:RNA polymerase sigma factor [Paenibacillus roseipurpureus]|uniref:RNA polymerase sigma factor n=1 Tax=Paenibacillus roseopurpureus TaxID=2918901 RepID=A0AA96RJL5_9BACL|nr:RNA polymerase sigma factor [Paenibacillus sp. MBLB1832]WNR45498.1 RNA polymerase sigma factor [Paenibacillus sp. MBLB1832]
MDNMTDEQLIEQIRQGHTEAYRVVVERHKTYIYTLVYRMVGHKETAEDLTQEVFVKLFRSLSHFRGDAKLTTWLYRMTTNLVTDYRRAQRRRPYEALLDKMKSWFTDTRDEPEQVAIRRDEQAHMQELLSELPDKYRMIMILYHFKQLSYSEMSEITGIPIKTLETRLYRGKAMLKQKWLEVNRHDIEAPSRHAAHAIPE